MRRFRLIKTVKISRRATNIDLATMVLITSEPVIACFRKDIRKQAKSIDVEVLSLLKSEARASLGSIVSDSGEPAALAESENSELNESSNDDSELEKESLSEEEDPSTE